MAEKKKEQIILHFNRGGRDVCVMDTHKRKRRVHTVRQGPIAWVSRQALCRWCDCAVACFLYERKRGICF